MKKFSLKIILALISYLPSALSMDAPNPGAFKNGLNLNDIVLVHVTNVKPSISYDERAVILKTGGSYFSSLEYKDDGQIIASERDFSRPYRVTLHWSTNGVTRVAGAIVDGKRHFGVPARYIIIEKISALKNSLWGGRFDDFYSIGDHELSKDAVLLVPENDADISIFSQFITVGTMKDVPANSSSEHLRSYAEEVLGILNKPLMRFNGALLSKELLSIIYKISFPSHWNLMNAQDLLNDADFAAINKSYDDYVGAIIDYTDGTRFFLCKDTDRRFDATCALFENIPDKAETQLYFKNMKEMLGAISCFPPEIDVLHPASRINDYGNKIGATYKVFNAEERKFLIQDLKLYVEQAFLKSEKLPPKGFYVVLARMEETLQKF
jgi:hypothetical protein